ncbi:hypothetical protein BDV12DRAFT_163306 [Aspergillus spectabilis]
MHSTRWYKVDEQSCQAIAATVTMAHNASLLYIPRSAPDSLTSHDAPSLSVY